MTVEANHALVLLVEAARAAPDDRVPPSFAVSGRQDLNLRPLDPQIAARRSRLASLQVKRHAQARSVLLSVLALLYSTAVLGEGRIRGRDDPALIRLAQSPETMTLQRLDSIEPWFTRSRRPAPGLGWRRRG